MGLLDELEQEAQRRKATMSDAERLKQERETAFKTVLDPGMNALNEYLLKLTNNLKFLKPKVAIRHEIPGYGVIVANYEHDYEVKVDATPTSKEINLLFNAAVVSEECPTLEVSGAGKIRTVNSLFQKYRLAGLHEFKKDDNGEMTQATFRARGKIPLSVNLMTDVDSAQVRMTFTNFDTLGVVTKAVAATQFNEQLFDEIGRFLAREQSSLFRESLPDDYRKQLQHKLQQDNMRRKWETKIAEQQKEELERLRREQGLKAKLNQAVQEVKEKAPSLLDKVKGIFKR
jgi:hypothetical protein